MNNKTSYSDEALINLAQQGNQRAYNLLLSRYINKIQQTIYIHVSDQAYVNDIMDSGSAGLKFIMIFALF